MPKIRLSATDFDPDAAPATGFSNYDGPVPPAGLYRTRAKLWRLKKAASGNTMIVVIFEIADETGEKAQYNGYPIWHNLVLTVKSSPFVNAALVAVGVDPHDLAEGTVTKADKTTDIVSIGGVKVQGAPVLVTTKRETYEGEVKLAATSFAKAGPRAVPAEKTTDDAFDPFANEDEDESEEAPKAAAVESDDPWAVADDGEAAGEAY